MPLERPREADPAYALVLDLAKRARKTVGFLPDSAFAERARQGTLLACVEDDRVVGYALYDLPRDEIRIVQLVVAPDRRGSGVARSLVEAVAAAHPDRRGILLHCRNDFPAHGMWPKLDFVPVGERPGNSVDGKPLTRWFRSFGQPDLFTFLHEADSRPVATMDSCVFFDLVALRPRTVARQLRADWLVEHVRLAVTDQLFVEISKDDDPDQRHRERAAAEPFRSTETPSAVWRPVFDSLLGAHPTAPLKDQEDLKHVAQAMAMQSQWLITSDRLFVRRYSATCDALGGLRLVSPAAFLREVDERGRSDRYRPVDLAGTAVTRREVSGSDLPLLADTFVNHQHGERIGDLRRSIELAAAQPTHSHLELVEVDGEPRGLLGWEVKDELSVTLLRVTAGRGETTIGRHLLGLVRSHAVAAGAETIRVADPTPSALAQHSFRDEGFAPTSGGPIAHALCGSGSLDELHTRALALGSPAAGAELVAASAERWYAPYRVLGAGIPSFVVPIRAGWATALFDAGLAEGQLFAREWDIGLRRELVYYRHPANSRGLAAPARLIWYVSGSGPGAGTIRAVSQLTEVAVGAHERLFHRFAALGVYSAEDVRGCADEQGRVMALRFSKTHLLKHPVSLDAFRQLITGDPKSKQVVLQSPIAVSEQVFMSLLAIGTSRDE